MCLLPSQDRDVFSFLGEIAESKQGNQHACFSSLMFSQRRSSTQMCS